MNSLPGPPARSCTIRTLIGDVQVSVWDCTRRSSLTPSEPEANPPAGVDQTLMISEWRMTQGADLCGHADELDETKFLYHQRQGISGPRNNYG